MRKKHLVVLAGFLSSSWGTVGLAEEALVRSTLEPGAAYRYELIDLFKNEAIETIEQTVLSVSGDQATLQHVSNTRGAAHWTFNMASQKEIPRNRKGTFQAVRFPSAIGDTWQYEYSNPSQVNPAVITTQVMTAKFIGWEKTTVPAGTYRAAKIEHYGEWNWSSGERGREHYILWYSPDVKRFVRERYFSYLGNGTVVMQLERQLTKYQPAPDMSNPFAVPSK